MESLNLISLLRLIIRWRKPLLLITALAVVGSVIITMPFIMPPKYKSESVILAASPLMTSGSSLFLNTGTGYFGLEEDIDRLLSIAKSNELKQFIVRKYKLFEHYDIDSTKARYPMYSVMKELDDNVSVVKNDRGAVEITVYDTDRKLAADIANDIVAKIDDINNEIMLESKRKIYSIFDNKIKAKEKEMSELSDTILKLKERSSRVNRLSDLRKAVSATGDEAIAMAADEERLSVLEERKKSGLRELNNTVSLAEQMKSTLNKDVSTIFILEHASPAEKKSKPIRWLIVLGAMLGSFFLSLIAVALIERFRSVRWKEVLQYQD